MSDSTPAQFPIDGTLDLHTFKPNEVKDLIPDYIEACLEKKIYQIRIIHGKGTGTLRKIVHSILEKHPDVIRYGQDDITGGWGATIVELKEN
jgi:DNA-nicking Smr family endonuclease